MIRTSCCAVLLAAAAFGGDAIDPKSFAKAGTVSDRFLGFNVEMVEVTGGRFWAPYKAAAPSQQAGNPGFAGLDPNAFRYRPPIDLSNARLRKLAAGLKPSYVRVSGTWANSTYFQNNDDPAPKNPPDGFGGVLTRAQWKGVVDFAKAVDGGIVTSFGISPGTRDANGLWTTKNAKEWLDYTKSLGGSIAAVEFFNETTMASVGGAPKGYNAESFARDYKVFVPFLREASPKTVLMGPSAIAEHWEGSQMQTVSSRDMLRLTGPVNDAFSYHFYGGVSQRCKALGPALQTTIDKALTNTWFSRAEEDWKFYSAVRDAGEPGKPMWLTETGETACGGNPWASTYADSFRYLEQLARLAKHGVQGVMHNTLAASDYALLNEDDFSPRPNYWAAYLWKKTMGTTVLEAGASTPEVNLYAHCQAGRPGGVTLLAINHDANAAHTVELGAKGERFTLTAKQLTAGQVELNGKTLALGAGDTLPALKGQAVKKGKLELAPASITFVTFAGAGNQACK